MRHSVRSSYSCLGSTVGPKRIEYTDRRRETGKDADEQGNNCIRVRIILRKVEYEECDGCQISAGTTKLSIDKN